MKHLLNGIAIAAVFAIAAPALAQNAPMTPAAPPAKTAPAAAPMAAPMKGATAMPKKPMRHRMARRGMMRQGGGGGGDRMTEDLNRQELARLQGGGMAPQGGMAAEPRESRAEHPGSRCCMPAGRLEGEDTMEMQGPSAHSLVTVVCPVYNEERSVEIFRARLWAAMKDEAASG